MTDDTKGLIGIVTVGLIWMVVALGPTAAVVWIAVHFIRKFW